jgi:hypothetical protein
MEEALGDAAPRSGVAQSELPWQAIRGVAANIF